MSNSMDVQIQRSKADECDYRYLELDNGIRVLLVSDPKSENGAACMTVRVGGYYNPKTAPGLAHFTEHMLFMGSERYPKENYYVEQISKNGGELNGSTSHTKTNYYFKITKDKYEHVLDVFSRFFI